MSQRYVTSTKYDEHVNDMIAMTLYKKKLSGTLSLYCNLTKCKHGRQWENQLCSVPTCVSRGPIHNFSSVKAQSLGNLFLSLHQSVSLSLSAPLGGL